ncbi:MAG: nucleotidyltransferase domain-containing protein [Gammaproteobacteria bacterium]|nr:nucleotidyltransferase domain-containing protein [Gammaproteobacteria bacterium]
MRLSAKQRRIIREAVRDHFGEKATVRLFGSRADDSARGGDIDLLIETPSRDVTEIARAEIAFQSHLQQQLGDQKLDLLINYPGRRTHPLIFKIAEETGVPL